MSEDIRGLFDLREGYAWYRRLDEPDPETGKFSLCVAFKDSGDTGKWLDRLENALTALGEAEFGKGKKFGIPLKRGENCKADGYASINTGSKFDVQVVKYSDSGEVVEADPRDVRKGVPVIASVNFRTYNKGGNKGVTSYIKYVCITGNKPDQDFLEASTSEEGGGSALSHFKPRKPAAKEEGEEAPSF